MNSLTRILKPVLFLLTICLTGTIISVNAATYTVDNTSDDASKNGCTTKTNDCSLRGAINLANASTDDDTIDFDDSLANQKITLGGKHLSITDNGRLTINGLGAIRLSVSGDKKSNVFFIAKNVNVSINDITVTNGYRRSGGGINNFGNLLLTNSTVSDNSGNRSGGGISNNGGRLTVINSTISNNFIYMSGGSAGGGQRTRNRWVRRTGTKTRRGSRDGDSLASG